MSAPLWFFLAGLLYMLGGVVEGYRRGTLLGRILAGAGAFCFFLSIFLAATP